MRRARPNCRSAGGSWRAARPRARHTRGRSDTKAHTTLPPLLLSSHVYLHLYLFVCGLQLSHLQKGVSKLKRALDEAQASGRQGARDTAAAEQRVKELRLELASTQASHKESMELVGSLLLPH